MTATSPASRWRGDLVAGFIAIVFVLGVAIRAAVVGSDLRALFAVSMLAFFAAGLARGGSIGGVWTRGLVTSSPGLLGTAALIVNDGLSRWPIPLAISIVSILFATLGIRCRRDWATRRMRGAIAGAASAIAVPVIALALVPLLVSFASNETTETAVRSFSLRSATGEVVTSKVFRGRVVVLAAWATWCLPCRWELPEVDRAWRRFDGNARVAFLAVDRGSDEETPARARQYLEKSRLAIPLAFEDAGFADVLGSDALPAIVILDGQGRARFIHHGYDASERLADVLTHKVNELLDESAR